MNQTFPPAHETAPLFLYVIRHIILAPDILDLENLDFVSVGKFMKS